MNVFDDIRKEYETAGLHDDDLASDPNQQFRIWFDEAVERSPGKWAEPNAMTLSTSAGGIVTSRTVLLKDFAQGKYTFFTNYESEKGQQLAQNPHASLLFHWAYLGRQIRIQGTVEKTTREISESYFHSRPRGAQLGATASAQSRQLESRKNLEQLKQELESRFEGQPVPLPDFWGGFALTATRFEFWQGRLDRMHDRFRYTLNGDAWAVARLNP